MAPTADYIALGLVLAAALYLFWQHKLRTDVTALLVTLALILPWPHPDARWRSVLTYQEGFSGFGSVAVVMVVSMFVFGGAIVRTGAAEFLGMRLFRMCARHELLMQAAVLLVTTVVSMFVNDTTVVLIFMPLILTVCKEKSLSPSRYLLLAAYGSLLGGQWTLIGTRSNIVISDYFARQQIAAGQAVAGLGFFDFTRIAAVVFAACAASFYFYGRKLLPAASALDEQAEELARDYLTEAKVTPQSGTVGKTLDQLAWTKRADLTVIEVIRGDERMPASKWLKLQPGDVLVMRGPVPVMGELLKSPDFQLKEEVKLDANMLRSMDLVTVEALLAPRSDYAGRSLEQVDFSHDYGFTVMGISRHGKTIHERPMSTRLEFGDSLLLLGYIAGVDRLAHNPNLMILGQRPFHPVGKTKALITMALLAGLIATAVSGMLSPAVSIPLVAMLVILFGCVKVEDAYKSVDWKSVVTVAGMIPFGVALEKTGAAAGLAQWIVNTLAGLNPTVVLGIILLLAVLFTQLIENAAVAIILAPLAYQVAMETGADPKPFMVSLAICVSASFCTPIAHESTILVMGPGRYEFKHYLRVGGVMAILTWLVATVVTPWVWPF
ncbi:MAG TPA: SLC13 family permease [Verrucomicrobiae bacterium]